MLTNSSQGTFLVHPIPSLYLFPFVAFIDGILYIKIKTAGTFQRENFLRLLFLISLHWKRLTYITWMGCARIKSRRHAVTYYNAFYRCYKYHIPYYMRFNGWLTFNRTGDLRPPWSSSFSNGFPRLEGKIKLKKILFFFTSYNTTQIFLEKFELFIHKIKLSFSAKKVFIRNPQSLYFRFLCVKLRVFYKAHACFDSNAHSTRSYFCFRIKSDDFVFGPKYGRQKVYNNNSGKAYR